MRYHCKAKESPLSRNSKGSNFLMKIKVKNCEKIEDVKDFLLKLLEDASY